MQLPIYDDRYGHPSYLTHSALSNFVSYDNRGTPLYSVFNFLNQTQPESKAVKIGSIADKIITEGLILSEAYTVSMTKEEMLEKLAKFDTGLTMKNTVKDIKAVYEEHYGVQEQLEPAVYRTIERVVERSYNFRYDKTSTLQDFIAECEWQTVLQDDKRMRKGKADFINMKRKIIADLKVVGNLDRFLMEIQYMGRLNITHKYPRQLAYYNDLTATKDFDGELFVIDHTGRHIVIHIPNAMLRSIQEEFTEPAIVKLYTILDQDNYAVEFLDPRTADELPA
jgi:hypothetical protein